MSAGRDYDTGIMGYRDVGMDAMPGSWAPRSSLTLIDFAAFLVVHREIGKERCGMPLSVCALVFCRALYKTLAIALMALFGESMTRQDHAIYHCRKRCFRNRDI